MPASKHPDHPRKCEKCGMQLDSTNKLKGERAYACAFCHHITTYKLASQAEAERNRVKRMLAGKSKAEILALLSN